MARAYQRLKSEAQKGRNTRKVLNWANRLTKLEVAQFETTARLVSLLQRLPEEELTEADKGYLVAAEEFRAHLKEVLSAQA